MVLDLKTPKEKISIKKIKDSRVLIDSNILIYNSDTGSLFHQMSSDFIEIGIESFYHPFISHQNIVESVRVMTHPSMPFALNSAEVLTHISYCENLATIIYPQLSTLGIFRNLVEKYQIVGARLHDAYLVATAISNGVNLIATYDASDFAIYEEIISFAPDQILRQFVL